MHIFDVLEAWVFSMGAIIGSSGVIVRFDRSPTDRSNPSCSLNLRRDDQEVDVLIWESGQAELAVGSIDGPISQVHFDDIRNQTDLGKLLSKLVEFIVLS